MRLGTKLHENLNYIKDYPYTISFCIKKALQIESFFELPKDRRPDESIWDNNKELEEWMDNLSENKPTKMEIVVEDIE